MVAAVIDDYDDYGDDGVLVFYSSSHEDFTPMAREATTITYRGDDDDQYFRAVTSCPQICEPCVLLDPKP